MIGRSLARRRRCCRTSLDPTNRSTDNVPPQDETDRAHQKAQPLFVLLVSFSIEYSQSMSKKGVDLGSMTHPDQKRSS